MYFWLVLLFASLCAEDLLIMVEAPHFDYTSPSTILRSISQHPRNGRKDGTVGHAWICLTGYPCIEGGHTGETGRLQPRYLEGVVDLSEAEDPDPFRYLFTIQHDGYFEKGAGIHRPTYAIAISLTPETSQTIRSFIATYDFSEYALTGNQCCTFVTHLASLAGVTLECRQTIPVEHHLLTFGSPDRLEQSMQMAVREGKAGNITPWAQKRYSRRARR